MARRPRSRASAPPTPTCKDCPRDQPTRRQVTPISGFPECLPADRIVEQHFLDVIRDTFELHGFASVETRAVEPIERLAGQGEDADKEIYAVSRLAAGEEDVGGGPSWACTST